MVNNRPRHFYNTFKIKLYLETLRYRRKHWACANSYLCVSMTDPDQHWLIFSFQDILPKNYSIYKK